MKKEVIEKGLTALGIEFGSTRIKAVLVDENSTPLASGSFTWENRLENGVWTYGLEEVKLGLKSAYASLKKEVKERYGITLKKIGAMGVSAMMHGYLAFDENWRLLVPFRTWRNTITGQASKELSTLFKFNVPERWSIAHLGQAILNGEEHLKDIRYFTTLAGYVHYLLSGKNLLGIGDASGMFPIDSKTLSYNEEMLVAFNAWAEGKGFSKKLEEMLPPIMLAGANGGTLTLEGARLLDDDGDLEEGALLCPPEGDAGTGMVATNSIKPLSGNVSAGTSVFAMAVLDKPLKGYYPEIDVVTTPMGKDVAMVHCNNCSGDIDAYVRLFREAISTFGFEVSLDKAYETLLKSALEGKKDCGSIVTLNYISGESITGFTKGNPMLVRGAESKLNVSDIMRSALYSAFATLRIGMDILYSKEGLMLKSIAGHGGYFKTAEVGGIMASSALKTAVTVTQTAGEGGPWGMAILANFARSGVKDLDEYLESVVFKDSVTKCYVAPVEDQEGFSAYMENYAKILKAERAYQE